ncbi:hypothetical protein C492_19117 [Natronococcus jeotgali DSM 18795]|uniref:Uncharacterized protein n=1 Tax=Natronococcus jeotgali DSM 18795 TaxID=1227498 RepID=L9WU87_9EURY|nr:hypothetical protein C492_19117 [Natronococcus jeotgali DSM 18795]
MVLSLLLQLAVNLVRSRIALMRVRQIGFDMSVDTTDNVLWIGAIGEDNCIRFNRYETLFSKEPP